MADLENNLTTCHEGLHCGGSWRANRQRQDFNSDRTEIILIKTCYQVYCWTFEATNIIAFCCPPHKRRNKGKKTTIWPCKVGTTGTGTSTPLFLKPLFEHVHRGSLTKCSCCCCGVYRIWSLKSASVDVINQPPLVIIRSS